MLHKHDQISNRIAYAIVTASMLICSALILHAGIPPKIHDISLIGIATFLFALVMSSLLLISILRHGKM
jgi:ubiquinone biosynthesis protein